MDNEMSMEEALGKITKLYEGMYLKVLMCDKDVDSEGFRKIQHKFIDIVIDKLNAKYEPKKDLLASASQNSK